MASAPSTPGSLSSSHAAPVPTIHEAERESGPSGAVIRGAEIEMAERCSNRLLPRPSGDWLAYTAAENRERWRSYFGPRPGQSNGRARKQTRGFIRVLPAKAGFRSRIRWPDRP